MRTPMVVCILALLSACMPAKGPSTDSSPASSLAGKTIALVESDEDGAARAYCSGVWVDDKRILTAAHCVRANPFAKLFGLDDSIRYVTRGDVFPDGRNETKFPTLHLAFRVIVDSDHDLALLSTGDDTPLHENAKLTEGPIEQGAKAYSMGHPKGYWWSYLSGEIAATRQATGPLDLPVWWIQTTAPISPGNSGGGLFNPRGELMGICSWKAGGRGAEGLGFYVHRDHVAKFLKAAQ